MDVWKRKNLMSLHHICQTCYEMLHTRDQSEWRIETVWQGEELGPSIWYGFSDVWAFFWLSDGPVLQRPTAWSVFRDAHDTKIFCQKSLWTSGTMRASIIHINSMARFVLWGHFEAVWRPYLRSKTDQNHCHPLMCPTTEYTICRTHC